MRSERMSVMPSVTHDAGVKPGDTTVSAGTKPILLWVK